MLGIEEQESPCTKHVIKRILTKGPGSMVKSAWDFTIKPLAL